MNKLTMLLSNGIIAAGTLVVPSRKLYVYLTVVSALELEPYLELWKSVPCGTGVLIVVIERIRGLDVPSFEGTAGRAKG